MIYEINTKFQKYSTSESAKQIIKELEEQKDKITRLDLSYNTFSPDVFSEIAGIIKEMKQLKHVKLESILDSLTFEEMCEVLTALSNALPRDLDAFELPSNAVSCNFPEEFGKFLEECPLKILNLHNCGLGEDGLKKVVAHLAKLEDKCNLASLNLSKNRINVICEEFADVFSEFKNLTEFILYANTIEEKSLARFLKNISNENLQKVNLTDNFVCGEAIDALGEVVLKNKVKELHLQDIKVDEGDIARLLGILARRKEMEFPGTLSTERPELVLDISCNFFKQDCVEALENLTAIYRFKKLIIFDNDFENIEKLKKLVHLDSGSVIDEEEEEEEIDEDLISRLKAL